MSQSGFERTANYTPLFYYFDVTLRACEPSLYYEIDDDLHAIRDGLDSSLISVPHGHTYVRGDWAGNPLVVGSNNTGTMVTIDGLDSGTTVRRGDWLQFDYGMTSTAAGRRKVYQVGGSESMYTVGSTRMITLTLNTPLISSPPDNAPVVTGADVMFSMVATNIPTAYTIPGANGQLLYNWSDRISFREVL